MSDNCFIETDDTLGWLDDDDGKKLDAALEKFKAEGYSRWPDDQIPDEDTYEFSFYGPLLFARPLTK